MVQNKMLKYRIEKFLEEYPELAPSFENLLAEIEQTSELDTEEIRAKLEDIATSLPREIKPQPTQNVASQASSSFQSEEQFFQRIVEATTEPITVFSENGDIFLSNNAFYSLFDIEEHPSNAASINQFLTEESRHTYASSILSALEQGGTWEGILKVQSTTGKQFPVWMRADAVLDDRQRILFIVALMHDASAQDLVERTLSSLQKGGYTFAKQDDPNLVLRQLGDAIGRQKALLHCILDIAWLKDSDGNFLAVNKVFCRWFGVTEEDIIGADDSQLFSHETAQLMQLTDQRVIRERKLVRKEIPIQDADGKVYWCEVIKVPSLDDSGNVTGIAGLLRDISIGKNKPAAPQSQLEPNPPAEQKAETQSYKTIPAKVEPQVKPERTEPDVTPKQTGSTPQAKYDLQQRDAIMAAITLAAEYFLRVPPWEKHIQEVLEWLGRATNVSRVHLFQNSRSENGKVFAQQRYEWVASGVSPTLNNEILQHLDYEDQGFRPWVESMKSGDIILGNIATFPEEEKRLFQSLQIKSIVAVPIFVDGAWWGFLCFDETVIERAWKPIIIDVLKTAANLIGAVIERERTEGTYRAMVEQSLQELLIAQNGRIVYANPEAIRNSELSEQELYRFGSTDLYTGVVEEDREKVAEALSRLKAGNAENIRIEFRSKKKDGSVRWVESLFSMVHYKGNPAIQIVQVDISDRKRIEFTLNERSSLEHIIAELSACFINLSYKEIDNAIARALKMLASFFNADHCYLFMVDDERSTGRIEYEWYAENMPPLEALVEETDISEFYWLRTKFKEQSSILINNFDEIPEDAVAERQMFLKLGLQSFALTAVVEQEQVIGNLTLGYKKSQGQLSGDIVPAMTLASEIIVNAVQRKRAEEGLVRTREMYKLATEAGNVGVWDWNLVDNTIFIDPTLKEMLGYTDSEIPNDIETWIRYIHPEDYPVAEERVRRIFKLEVETYQTEHRMIHKDGRALWFLVRGLVIRNEQGEPIRIVGTDTNVTELKKAEEALRASEGWNRAILNSLPDEVYILNQEGVYTDVMASDDSKSEQARLEFFGKSIFEIMDKKDADVFLKKMTNVLQTGEIDVVEYSISGKEEPENYVYYESRLSRLSQNSILALTRDITERKRAEQAVVESNETLKTRNEELDAFSHTVAHDLKNPLTLVIGYAGLLNEAASDMKPAEVKQYLSNILLNSKRMNSIIESLLLLAEVRQEDVKLDKIDMKFIVDESLSRLGYMIQEYKAVVVMSDEWQSSYGYSSWVEEVWVNYITNAMKYGGRPPRIELGSDRAIPGYVRYWVKDNGRGIGKDDVEKLFSPLTRLSSGSIKGYGLGLSIVKRIIEKLNGKTGVESEIGKGSMFWFALPEDLEIIS